jgi:hypothetical protein
MVSCGFFRTLKYILRFHKIYGISSQDKKLFDCQGGVHSMESVNYKRIPIWPFLKFVEYLYGIYVHIYRLWGPPNLLYNGYRELFPGGKAAGA